MASALGVFGTIPFVCSSSAVLTFKDLQVERTDRWATHDVLGQKPKLEFIGQQLISVSFSIQLSASHGISPVLAMLTLKRIMEKHQPQRLMIGTDYFGKFILESMSENRKHHNNFGQCVYAEVTLTLREAA